MVSSKRKTAPHLINLFEWADGLTKVLKIKVLWSKVFDKLVKQEYIEMKRASVTSDGEIFSVITRFS